MAEVGVEELVPQFSEPKSLRNAIACTRPSVALPFVCMNNKGSVAVFYEFNNHIYRVVGQVDKGTENPFQLMVSWGEEEDYGDGCKVQACLTDNNVIVLVRERKWLRECVYSIGTITDNLTINWKERDRFLTKGTNPTVAVTGDTVLFLHETDFGQCRSFYNVFALNEKDLTLRLKGQSDCGLLGLNEYTDLSVAVNSHGDLVICCRHAYTKSLSYAVGKLKDYLLTGITTTNRYASGSSPRVCLLDNRMAVAVHVAVVGTGIHYVSGNLCLEQGIIDWGRVRQYENGYYPAIAVNDENQMVEFHTDLKISSQLWYRLGTGQLT